MPDIYYRGDSIPLNITFKDSNNVAFDLDSFDDIELKVVNKSTHDVIKTLSLSAGTVTKVNAASGECRGVVDGTDTASVRTGVYIVQAKTQETNSDFTPKQYRYGQINGFILKESL